MSFINEENLTASKECSIDKLKQLKAESTSLRNISIAFSAFNASFGGELVGYSVIKGFNPALIVMGITMFGVATCIGFCAKYDNDNVKEYDQKIKEYEKQLNDSNKYSE